MEGVSGGGAELCLFVPMSYKNVGGGFSSNNTQCQSRSFSLPSYGL